jgi:hypothetical protein
MKLTELNQKPAMLSKKALNENYSINFDVDRLSMPATRTMLQKIRGLMTETKESTDYYRSESNPTYMKLVFMREALTAHLNQFQSHRIVTENEEVEKSQVVLAAQDMVDQIQKMLEDVGQMQVKELPALVSSIESEIGVNESTTYNDQVSQQLDALTAVLKDSLAGLKGALNGITGQGDMSAPSEFGAEMPGDDMGDDMSDVGIAAPEMAAPDEEPEAALVPGAGRALR